MTFTLNLTHLATNIPASEPLSSLEAMWWLASLAADDSRNHVKSYFLEDLSSSFVHQKEEGFFFLIN